MTTAGAAGFLRREVGTNRKRFRREAIAATVRRDHAIIVVFAQIGLRVSEVTGLRCGDIHLGAGAHVTTIGEGRKQRITPLTKATAAVLPAWLAERGSAPAEALFPTSTGTPLSRKECWLAALGRSDLIDKGDMLLEALVACAGVTFRAVATALDISVRSGRVRAEGDLALRGTLGVDSEPPVGFSAVRLSFELNTDADEGQLATLCKLTERYCVVYQLWRAHRRCRPPSRPRS